MIREWFVHPCLRVANVQRYSTVPTIHKESVAEHTFYVTLLSFKLAVAAGANIEKTLTIAMAHDLDEAFSGDMPRPFKYYSRDGNDDTLKRFLDATCHHMMQRTLEDDDVELLMAWEDSKAGSLEAQIVKFADLWSCLLFAYRERLLGSSTFADQVLDRAPDNFNAIVWDKKLQPYVKELLEFAARNYL